MFDLQVLAWQADITRVSTFLMCQGAEQRRLSEERRPRCVPHPVAPLERPREHGSVRRAEPLPRRRCSRYLLDKLQATPDGDGTLLDHSWCSTAARMSDGNQHNHYRCRSCWPAARRDAEGRTAHPQHAEEHADVEPAAGDARQARRADREVRRQQRRGKPLRQAQSPKPKARTLVQPGEQHDVGIHVGHRRVHVLPVSRPRDAPGNDHIALAEVGELAPLTAVGRNRPDIGRRTIDQWHRQPLAIWRWEGVEVDCGRRDARAGDSRDH